MVTLDEIEAIGINPDHVNLGPIEAGCDANLGDQWELRLGGRVNRYVILNPSSLGDKGPVVHTTECSSLQGHMPCEERYTERQILDLFRLAVSARRHSCQVAGFCQTCTVRRIQ